jgi:hypothetical protein
MPRVTFYFDGFNFYNGLRSISQTDHSWHSFYWLDFIKFCQQFLSGDQQLEGVKYFTATPLGVGKQARQALLFKANLLLNPAHFKIIKGKYYKKDVTCDSCTTVFQVPEEKRTDVNISVEMLGDCALDKTDILVLISADSDLVPVINHIITNYPNKKVRVYFPPKRSSADLQSSMNGKVVRLENNKPKFISAVMPNDITIGGVVKASKPTTW